MAHRVVLTVAVAFASALVLASASVDVDAVCGAVALHTLTFACGGLCDPRASCTLQDASAPSSPCWDAGSDCVPAPSGACEAECFKPLNATATAFTFYVTFGAGAASSTLVVGSNASFYPNGSGSFVDDRVPGARAGGVADDVPSESNDFVRRIGELALPVSVTTVMISGGRSPVGTRGRVADLEMDATIFHSAPQVTSVALVNIDLRGREASISALVPSNVASLDLHNTRMRQIPTSLTSIPTLNTLILDMNEIVEVPSSVNLYHQLKTLRLSENAMTAFSASIPSLEFLDLSNNRLESFPYDALESATNLRSLRLANNPTMKPVVFSSTQFTKILSLEEFAVDKSVLDHASCGASQVQSIPTIPGVSVCVLTNSEWAARYISARGHGKRKIVLVVSLVAAVIVVAVAVGAYCLWRRKTHAARGKSSSTHTMPTDFERAYDDNHDEFRGSIQITTSATDHRMRPSRLDVSSGSSPRYRLSHDADLLAHRIPNALLQDARVLGTGGFAVVWLVQFAPQNRKLASKRLAQDHVTRQQTIEFIVEIKLNMQLVHPSIVQFVGVAWTTELDLQALFEYMPNGDLRAHLDATDANRSPWGFEKLRIAIDIIEALVYVHSFSPPLVHRDLKSRDVLLAEDMKAKLCDFGVSRFASWSNTMAATVGTGRWLAPEVVAGSTCYDESCDIYAFGVILSELDTHIVPYDDVEDLQGNRLTEVRMLQMVASGQLTPTLSASCPEEIRQVAHHCLAFHPTDRPTAIGVAYALRRLRNDWAKHKKLFRTE